MQKTSDIVVTEVRLGFVQYPFRCPIKFGGRALDRGTVLNVAVRLRARSGVEAVGFGSMPMGNAWSFPSAALGYDRTLAAMQALAGRVARRLPDASGGEALHPLDYGVLLEGLAAAAAEAVERDLALGEPIPKLCRLVVASPFDAAIHDGFGKPMTTSRRSLAAGRSVYECYGPDFVNHDLARYLDASFSGEYLDRYISRRPAARLPLYHLVGALDPLTDVDLTSRIGDGLPETLTDWIRRDGLSHLKVKLDGRDLDWDVERVLAVDRVADGTASDRPWRFSLDFNERCENVDYLLAFLKRLEAAAPRALARVEYIEQPTARDLSAHPENRMHRAAAVKPVVIDESLVDYESLLLAQEMGYSGVALKACKGQSQALLMAAAGRKKGMFLCVQDLTCPGASFLHSAGLAAHVPGVAAIEGNARQYVPAANEGWRERFPGVFTVRDGSIETGAITGPGLGCVPPGYTGEDLDLAVQGRE